MNRRDVQRRGAARAPETGAARLCCVARSSTTCLPPLGVPVHAARRACLVTTAQAAQSAFYTTASGNLSSDRRSYSAVHILRLHFLAACAAWMYGRAGCKEREGYANRSGGTAARRGSAGWVRRHGTSCTQFSRSAG